jgi:plasmid stabilization system protein ParE
LIGLTARAATQLRALLAHYETRGRPEAVRGLLSPMEDASRRIAADPEAGLPAPRPYPQVARPAAPG